jgi:GT2 family glycosyltransferase
VSPLLSIVIISYNTREYLCRCIESIHRHAPPFPFEIIVVDNASTDGSAEAVRTKFPGVQVRVAARNQGYSSACNAGIRAGHSDYVLLLNSDTEMLAGTLEELVQALTSRPRAGAMSPLFVDGRLETIQMSWGWQPLFLGEIVQAFFTPRALAGQPWRVAIVQALQRRERTVPILCGAAMLLRRSVLEAIGCMDEDYLFYLEDSDVCARVWKAGWEVVFTPKSRIVHHLGKSSAAQPYRIALLYRQSQQLFYRKHGTALDRFLLGVYLRIKFWRMYWPPRESAASDFYRDMRGLLENRIKIELR